MAHSHDHAHAHGATNRTRLWAAIAIIGAFLVVQVVGGILSGSLALLADAGHMASDLIGLVVALVAAMVAARPATDRQTYGYRRAEVLGALVNGVILIVVAVSVAAAAVGRLVTGSEGDAHEVQGVPMLVVAVLGLLANVAAALVLRGGAKDSINLRGAYLEVVGGILSGSLALLADAGHMASDLIGLVVALVAAMVAARPATDRQTYGYRRAEVLGALVNGVILIVVAVSVAAAAVGRLVSGSEGDAHEVQGVPMLVVAVLGLLANVAAALVLRGGAKDSINLRGAYLEVLGDLIGSALVIMAAVVIVTTGFDAADPIASIAIAVLIVPRAVTLLRDVMHVLFESAPADTDVAEIREHLLGTAGVVAVHDVHVWQITSGSPVFSAHVEVEPSVFETGGTGALLDELGGCLADHFDVAHSTFQLEPAGRAEQEQPQHP